MTELLPAGSIDEMLPADQERVGRALSSAILRQIGDRKDVPAGEVLDAVSRDLSIRRNEMLFGLLYAEATDKIKFDSMAFTVSPYEAS